MAEARRKIDAETWNLLKRSGNPASLIKPDNPHPGSDRRAFEKWFAEAYPLPRSKAQRGMWKAKQRIAWAGWQAARSIPKPPPDKSLTRFKFTPLTPDDVAHLGDAESRIALQTQAPAQTFVD